MKKTIAISIIVSNMLFGASTVTNMETTFENTINGTSTINNSTVNQGKTSITNGTVYDVELKSKTAEKGNSIKSTSLTNGSKVDQATFLVNGTNDAPANVGVSDESDTTDITVSSDNSINSSKIDGSVVRQNYISVSGSTVNSMNVEQTNSIENTDGENENSNNFHIESSHISQGEFTFSDGATVTNLTQTGITNNITSSQATDATMSQNSITVNNSKLTDFENKQLTGSSETNLIQNTTITGTAGADKASIVQNSAKFLGGADITAMTTEQSNTVTGSGITNTHVLQGNIEVTGATVGEFDTQFTNSISSATINNTDDDTKTVEQGVLIVGGTGTLVADEFTADSDPLTIGTASTNNVDIESTNDLSNTTLTTSSLIQSKTTMNGDTKVDGLAMNQTNKVEDTDTENAPTSSANVATISQSETLISGGTVRTITQNVTNTINASTLDTATVAQGKTSITDSDVTNLTITQTNTIDSSTISGGSDVTQGSTIIDGSTSSEG